MRKTVSAWKTNSNGTPLHLASTLSRRRFLKSAQAAQARHQRRHQRPRNAPLPPGRSESVVRGFKKSAQAAQARHQRARNSPLPPGRSESVVREFLKSEAAATPPGPWRRASGAPPALLSSPNQDAGGDRTLGNIDAAAAARNNSHRNLLGGSDGKDARKYSGYSSRATRLNEPCAPLRGS